MNLRPFLSAILWLVLITYLSLTPGFQLPEVTFFSADKLGHAGAYGVLVLRIAWGLSKSAKRAATRRELSLIFVFASLYGVFMEWMQGTYFPNRFFEYGDMLANAAGAFMAVILILKYQKS